MILKLSPESVAITKRFFEALSVLKEQRKIRGLKTFTDQYNINYWNMHTLREEQDKRILKPEYLAYLVRDFGVSAEWLVVGRGSMFSKENLSMKRNANVSAKPT